MILPILTTLIMSLSGPGCTYVTTPINQTTTQIVGDRDGIGKHIPILIGNGLFSDIGRDNTDLDFCGWRFCHVCI